jgi:UDP-N-acetylglucosamine--N-acetylmuramyl-(pentapeptide) pyrophosphoryl-undecaprenol N-acetylglucosamine transferase
MKPVVIMAGGTGGHIFPGLAVAAALKLRGVPVTWLGAKNGLESRLVPEYGITFDAIEVSGLRGKGILQLLGAPWRIFKAIRTARSILRTKNPRSVLSMGGFAAGPGGVAAWRLGIALFVHEQNRIPGFTNRILARMAKTVFCGFPQTFAARTKAQDVGNPVRADIATIAEPSQRFSKRSGPLRILVLGGSQGARALNRALPLALALMDPQSRPSVRHQCGPKLADETRAAYKSADVNVIPEPFIRDMAAAYAWADLVICRAGALTIAELMAAGVGSILVPFPAAVDDHQTANAKYLVDAQAAVLLPRDQCLARGLRARVLSRPDAADVVAAACAQETT